MKTQRNARDKFKVATSVSHALDIVAYHSEPTKRAEARQTIYKAAQLLRDVEHRAQVMADALKSDGHLGKRQRADIAEWLEIMSGQSRDALNSIESQS